MKVYDKVQQISQRQENEKQVTLPMKVIAHKLNRIFGTVLKFTARKNANLLDFII